MLMVNQALADVLVEIDFSLGENITSLSDESKAILFNTVDYQLRYWCAVDNEGHYQLYRSPYQILADVAGVFRNSKVLGYDERQVLNYLAGRLMAMSDDD